jgi:PAS domain S-box-containing protein
VLAEAARLRETGGPFSAEYRYVARDGRIVWVRDETVIVRDESGRPLYVQGYLLDITGAKRAAEEIVRAKEYSETLIRTANVMIVGLDAEGRILVFNEAAEKITGYALEELAGRDWFEAIVPRERYPEVWADFEGWTEGGGLPETFENPIQTKSGEERFISWRNSEVTEGGRPIGTISFGIDVTERKTLEEQLRQSQKMEAVGRLAGGIAHDFNNLLTAISGYSDFALAQVDPASEAAGDIEEIRKAADRASSLTSQLLAFSRRQVLRPQVLDLNAIVTDMEAMLRRLIGEHIRLKVRLEGALEFARLDRGQMEQVLMNLALNARDAMPEGGDLIITTKNVLVDEGRANGHVGLEPGSYVMLVVSDTGAGMDDETKARAFEPFFTTKAPGKGTGLGLATVYGIVKQSGGSIWVDTMPGKGSIFTIFLPRAWEGARQAPVAPAEQNGAQGSETILLVEDESVVRSLVRKMLEGSGYTILEAEDGKQAFALSREHGGTIDLLLTDVVMPGMNGRELAERLWFSRPELRVLYMSGYTDSRVFNPDVLDPGSAFLHKPFTMSELAGKVRDVLDTPRAGVAA